MTVQRSDNRGDPPIGMSLTSMVVRALLRSIEASNWQPWCRIMTTIIMMVILAVILHIYGVTA